jgi:hypothetical protein
MDRSTQYPAHLAKLVAQRLQRDVGRSPPEHVLVRLFETLYFTSFKTDEGRRIRCTVNFVDPADATGLVPARAPADRWNYVRLEHVLPLDVRTLAKLARAADPEISSLAVYADDEGELYIWGMVDQEPRHGDRITLETDSASQRPGLFQATIGGTGNVSVYHNSTLLGNLSQSVLVETHYDVLWSGPVHILLSQYLDGYLAEHCPTLAVACGSPDAKHLERELLLRWLNSLSRVLVNVRHYHQGGGILMTPRSGLENVDVKYPIRYDRLIRSLVGLVRAHFLRNRGIESLRAAMEEDSKDSLQTVMSYLRDVHNELEERKNELLGAARFIASLSCVDGVVLLDREMVVHGFGVELRTDNDLRDVYMAGDAQAEGGRLRRVDLTHFGTRHRAMMRYCHLHPGALGFAVSQDGDIQAMTRIGARLVVWENIDVQLAFKPDNWFTGARDLAPILRRISLRVES